MCFFYSKLWTFRKKKKKRQKNQQKKSTSFLHEPCVLPASPSSPSPHFSSTDRNPAVPTLHVLATPVNVAFLSISFVGIGESPAPYSLPPWRSRWDPATRAAVALTDVQCSSWPFILPLWCPSPPRVRGSCDLPGLCRWRVPAAVAEAMGHRQPNGIPFPLCPDTRAGWPLLPSVTLPCFEGAGIGVCNPLCITCTVSLSYLSAGCFSYIWEGAPASWGVPWEAQCVCFIREWWKV